jgi:hypothetical protein
VEAAAISQAPTVDVVDRVSARSHAVPLLQLFALTVMVIPSDTIIRSIGAGGYPAGLLGLFAFAIFLAATLLGLHTLLDHRHPVRTALCFLWATALVSYVLMDRGTVSVVQAAGADRFLMQLMVITGVALVAAEWLHSRDDVNRVLRALCWGGAFCGVIAALQFWASVDLAPYLRELPGFSLNFDNAGILARGALNRAAGTAIHPIELGVVAGILMPLAIYLAMTDTTRTAARRWAPVALIGLAIPASVSRSAILAVTLSLALFVVLLPAVPRLVAFGALPLALVGVFMSAPGLIGTLTSFFQAGTTDPSVATRVSDYSLVERLVDQAPFFGRGGGTYIPDNLIDVLDNQYLKTAIELGLIGVVALAAFFLVPMIAALVARRHTADPDLRLLCAALAGAVLAAGVCSLTFDSFSFPMFSNVCALVVGLTGAVWRFVAAGDSSSGAGVRPDAKATENEIGGQPLPAGG